MPNVSLFIPQIGEGLQEARLVAVLKQPGEFVKRDEPIYQMETDKAVMDVESPYEGTLVSWSAEVDTVLAIGAEVVVMAVGDGVEVVMPHGHDGGHGAENAGHADADASGGEPASSGRAGLQGIPPRTRAYAKEKGITDDVLASILPAGSKVMPSDIDAYLAGAGSGVPSKGYSEVALGSKQRVLNSRMVRSNALVVPGTMTVVANWEPIERERARIKASGSDFQPSAFTMFAYCVAKALSEYPAFRSAMVGDDKVRTYDHANLGIAVSLPGDQLVLAVVEESDTLSWHDFAANMRAKIDLARGGQDQANESVTVSLTNMQAFGLRDAVPVVVAPGMATIFVGESYNGLASDTSDLKLQRSVNITMTFDHRLANGVGAAEFLNTVKKHVESITSVCVG